LRAATILPHPRRRELAAKRLTAESRSLTACTEAALRY
jgi:hypothetical protein